MNPKPSVFQIAVVLLFCMAVVLLFNAWLSILGAAIGLSLVTFVPGYTLIAAAFPRQGLALTERLAFSVGLSLCITVLVGVALNATPWGIHQASWMVTLGAIALATLGIARQRGGIVLPSRADLGRRICFPTPLSVVLFGCAALTLATAVGMAVVGQEQQRESGFTQLWIMPTPSPTGRAQVVQLGLVNREVATTTYRLQLSVAGRPLQVWRSISLRPGQQWTGTQVLPKRAQTAAKIVATLYRSSAPHSVYRQVWLQKALNSK